MRAFESADELVALEGPPHHRQQCDGFEIWHYPQVPKLVCPKLSLEFDLLQCALVIAIPPEDGG